MILDHVLDQSSLTTKPSGLDPNPAIQLSLRQIPALVRKLESSHYLVGPRRLATKHLNGGGLRLIARR